MQTFRKLLVVWKIEGGGRIERKINEKCLVWIKENDRIERKINEKCLVWIKENDSVAWPMVGIYRHWFRRDMGESVIAGVRCPIDNVGHESETKCYGIQRGYLEVLMPIHQL